MTVAWPSEEYTATTTGDDGDDHGSDDWYCEDYSDYGGGYCDDVDGGARWMTTAGHDG